MDSTELTPGPPAKRARREDEKSGSLDLSGTTIEIVVSSGVTFHIHKNLICNASPFFTNATKLEWAGSTSKPVELSDVLPEVFKIYMAFLYTKNLDGGHGPEYSWSLLTNAYVLGEIVMDPAFQQAIHNEMIRVTKNTKKFPSIQSINIIYNGTMPASPVRRLIVDLCASRANQDTFKKDTDGIKKLNPEFLQDSLQALLEHRQPPKGKKTEGQGVCSKKPKVSNVSKSKP
ncbi:hypothetical protein BDV96DRAFT_640180 [Lophiotrema nucula]|uniref:BTB domain-containing protein n=1 Tax=Lophiotrema nucula TaxID=690887 RepID=A0A6A5ZSS2_9PLEO|nr:hypothetical protein BDV96DRAFT_640180 [Lophiotrema nucula]